MTVAEFLIELSRNEELRAQFESNPRKAAEAFGLKGEKLELLAAGTLRDLRIKVEAELDVDGEIVAFETIWWFRRHAD